MRLMAMFSRDAAADPEVQRCALRAAAWGRGSSLAHRALGVWLWLKHCIKFRRDEITARRLGLGDAFDLVIDPRVLVRMQDPAEDCDGFATCGASLLRVLGIPFYFAAAATEGHEPGRWSHTWLVVALGGRLVDLDASHGRWFGWGVPAERRYRFGLWNSEGVRVA